MINVYVFIITLGNVDRENVCCTGKTGHFIFKGLWEPTGNRFAQGLTCQHMNSQCDMQSRVFDTNHRHCVECVNHLCHVDDDT